MGLKMKISEFKEAIDSIGLKYGINLEVKENEFYFDIKNCNRIIADISKLESCLMNTAYPRFSDLKEGARRDLLDVIYKFASTPIPEREEEKIYIVPLPHLTLSDGEQIYLTQTHQGNFFPSIRDKKLKQTWKEEHLKYIPEEYRKYAVEVEE